MNAPTHLKWYLALNRVFRMLCKPSRATKLSETKPVKLNGEKKHVHIQARATISTTQQHDILI